ncbi:MAG: twin-arginine translocase TatA/TatE family subunit, partial [Balneolaceae bacterium]
MDSSRIIMGFGGFEWLIIVVVILFLFGGKKIPQLARGLGRGLVEFRKAKDSDDDEIEGSEETDER